jgi:hypothetical protein
LPGLASLHFADGIWEDPICLEGGVVEQSMVRIWIFVVKVTDKFILGLDIL